MSFDLALNRVNIASLPTLPLDATNFPGDVATNFYYHQATRTGYYALRDNTDSLFAMASTLPLDSSLEAGILGSATIQYTNIVDVDQSTSTTNLGSVILLQNVDAPYGTTVHQRKIVDVFEVWQPIETYLPQNLHELNPTVFTFETAFVTDVPTPGNDTAGNLYFHRDVDDKIDIYMGDKFGTSVLKMFGDKDLTAGINNILGTSSRILAVPDIDARNNLTLLGNTLVLVADASADITVDTGYALYVYLVDEVAYTKVYEQEGNDISLEFNTIENRPTATALQIDTITTQSHTHPNKPTLDGISESDGRLSANGFTVGRPSTTTGW